MKNLIQILIVLIISSMLFSCAHTNDLAKHNVQGSTMHFKEVVKPAAKSVLIERSSTDTKKSKKNEDVVLDILTSVGTGFIEADKQNKLEEAIDTKDMLHSIAEKLSESINSYLDVTAVEQISDKPDYFCSVVLEEVKLLMSNNSVSLYVHSTASITKRTTGEMIWENSETKTIPLEDNTGNTTKNKSLENVFSAIQLAALDPNQIKKLVEDAADDVGTYMAETLREDVVDANKEKLGKK
ncbi:MAG: hypothetical protein KKF62_08465 [Bacteroidetes bacterium]|nr:hypothetical protein [Bacteroidota bacterium]MBU1117100.1 hypothetical protein [Bacteroidota bacterium]MBU1799768.1 hypothetical protein [Bacteroidota bacterium]